MIALVAVAACSAGCRGRDVEFDCEYSREKFDAIVAEEGRLRESIPGKGPYPAAMLLTAEGINRLLGSTVENDVPFTGDVPFGPSDIHFEPDADPVIEIAQVEGCDNCILYAIDFVVELTFGNSDVSSGEGHAKLAVPIELDVSEDGSTALFADYKEAEITDFEVTVYGLDSAEYEGMSEAISILMEEQVREDFDRTELMRFEPLGLGDGEVQLAAREVISFPDAGALALGLQTNLVLPQGTGLEIDPVLPEGIPMGMQFHPDFLLGISQRMLAEENIPRYYDENGQPRERDGDEGELLGVTMHEMRPSEIEDPLLDAIFRVWRLRGGYCGYAEARLQLFVELDEEDEDIFVRPGVVEVLSGKGIGSLAAEEDDVVKDNQHLVDNFKNAVANHLGLTVNYDSLSIEDKALYLFTKAVDVTPEALATHIDFVVVEAP